MPKITEANKKLVISEAIRLTEKGLTTFGDIADAVFGNQNAGAIVGEVVYLNRYKIPNWHRITNKDNHPIADEIAIRKLKEEGYVFRNGVIEL